MTKGWEWGPIFLIWREERKIGNIYQTWWFFYFSAAMKKFSWPSPDHTAHSQGVRRSRKGNKNQGRDRVGSRMGGKEKKIFQILVGIIREMSADRWYLSSSSECSFTDASSGTESPTHWNITFLLFRVSSLLYVRLPVPSDPVHLPRLQGGDLAFNMLNSWPGSCYLPLSLAFTAAMPNLACTL